MSAKTKIDVSGRTFGRLKVLHESGRHGGHVMWKCQCACGNECVVAGSRLKNGVTKSCGCLHSETGLRYANKNRIYNFSNYKANHPGGSIEDLEDLIR
jgi:hypothetical protein